MQGFIQLTNLTLFHRIRSTDISQRDVPDGLRVAQLFTKGKAFLGDDLKVTLLSFVNGRPGRGSSLMAVPLSRLLRLGGDAEMVAGGKGSASNGVMEISEGLEERDTFFHRLYRGIPLVQTLCEKGYEIHKKAEERLPGYAWIVSGPVQNAAASVSGRLMHIPKVGEYVEFVDSTACVLLQGILDKYPTLSRPPSELYEETRDCAKDRMEDALGMLARPSFTRRGLKWMETWIGIVEKACIGLANKTQLQDEAGVPGTWTTSALFAALRRLSQPALLFYSKCLKIVRRRVRSVRRMGRSLAEAGFVEAIPASDHDQRKKLTPKKRLSEGSSPARKLQETLLAPFYLLGLRCRGTGKIPMVSFKSVDTDGSPNRPDLANVERKRKLKTSSSSDEWDARVLLEPKLLEEEGQALDPDYMPPEELSDSTDSDSELDETDESEEDEEEKEEEMLGSADHDGGEAPDPSAE
ncbi:unnamed protein product [Darwinula stevensoni]|uniref:Uncharacterized protein n=1 Tax=Darwinula stevensoni TaxID=69355 RepID=A0A7R9A3Q5_9CRUS|nr:unnamed protein product [Darwinula stevensoni]CAG0882634.1 unnamed protein product [Darwinula stevensoni]